MSATSSLVPLSESISPGFSLRNFGASVLALASVAYGLIHIILPPVRNADLPRTSMRKAPARSHLRRCDGGN